MNSFLVRAITTIGLGAVVGTLFLILPTHLFSILIGLILLEILIFEWPRLAQKQTWLWWLTPLYPIAPTALLIILNEWQYYRLIAFLLTIVPAFDIGAYILGKLIGKHKLSSISPGKTWEGVLGGFLSVVVTMFFVRYFAGSKATSFFLIWFSLIITIIATIGDLFESWLKRRAGVKDSGSILPGHGGFLDRADAILFITVLFYHFRDFLTNYLLSG